jgi:hypothetical protein
MGIKGLKISMIVSISFDTEAMPRLNPQQGEQAICRLHAGTVELLWLELDQGHFNYTMITDAQ